MVVPRRLPRAGAAVCALSTVFLGVSGLSPAGAAPASPMRPDASRPASAAAATPGRARELPEVVVVHRDGTVSRIRTANVAAARELSRHLQADTSVRSVGVGHAVSILDDAAPAPQSTRSAAQATAADWDPNEILGWHLSHVNAPVLTGSWAQGHGVVVAVIDTGIDAAHHDLLGRVREKVDFSQCPIAGLADGCDPSGLHFHGTHVAGLVAAQIDRLGVVGLAPEAQLLDVRVLNSAGNGDFADVARGIDWAVEHGADIVNLSLGGSDPDAAVQAALQRATAAGVLVLAAAGNSGATDNAPSYPAAFPESIAVSAADWGEMGDAYYRADFSNYGPYVDIAAPGVDIWSDYPGGFATPASGTSMATPIVAGIAADVWSAEPDWTAAQVRDYLQTTALDQGAPGPDDVFGVGVARFVNPNPSPTPPWYTPPVTPSPPPMSPVLTLSVPASAAYGASPQLTGRLRSPAGVGLAGVVVTLQRHDTGASEWRSLATVTTNSSGSFAVKVRLTHGTVLRASTPAAAGRNAASATGNMLPRVPLTATSRTRGRSAVIGGSTGPAAGASVILQVRDPQTGWWRLKARARSSAAGAYTFRLPRGSHRSRLRVVVAPSRDWAGAEGASLYVDLR